MSEPPTNGDELQIEAVSKEQNSSDSKLSESTGRAHKHTFKTSSKIIGVLKELKDDIINCDNFSNIPGTSKPATPRGPVSGSGDVYIEQNGKFIKAPKELLSNFDYKTKEVYLEADGIGFDTPLDIAIKSEKCISTFSRISLGILAGLSLLQLILIYRIWDEIDLELAKEYYSVLVDMSSICFTILFPICLISLFDWLDLAHTNLQHFIDTLQRRKICFIILIYLCGFIFFLISVPYNDMIIAYNVNATMVSSEKEYKSDLRDWKTLATIYNALCLLGWVFIATTNNEDLFYLHLISMKKYEETDFQFMSFENQIARQLYPM